MIPSPSHSIDVKICGLSTLDAVATAVVGGARWVGFVFFPSSPRNVTPERAAVLAEAVPEVSGVSRVGLFVDPDDEALTRVLTMVPLDVVQLHGRETPERVAEVRARFGRPVIKALPISGPEDLDATRPYEAVSDLLLFDARAPKGATRPGGNAVPFDWTVLRGRTWRRPWLLAGGLHPGNVALALRISGARAVDVSSGVEDAPGIKSAVKIRAFLRAATPGEGPREA